MHSSKKESKSFKNAFLTGMEVGGFFMPHWLATCTNAKEIIQKILISLLTTVGKKTLGTCHS